MRNNFLTPREQAIVRGCWKINDTERAKLDKFFLLHDNWNNLEKDFVQDSLEVKRFLQHEGKLYEVICMQPVLVLEKAKQLGLSFRVHDKTNIRVVLINVWHEQEGQLNNG